MKKIINISLLMALVCAFSFVNISCSDDDDESTKPKITDFEWKAEMRYYHDRTRKNDSRRVIQTF